MSLLDKLRQPKGEKSEEIRQLQQAIGGREVGEETGPVRANLAEKLAGQQAAEVESDVAGMEQQVEQQINQQAESLANQLDDAQIRQLEQGLNAKQQLNQKTTELLNNAARSGKQLDFAKQKAKIEQVGFNLRMNNQKYIQSLQQNAAYARLDDDARFKEELQRSIWADELELFNNDLQFQRLMQAEGRELAQIMNDIEIDRLISIGDTEASQVGQQAIYDSLSNVASAGSQAFAKTGGDYFNSGDDGRFDKEIAAAPTNYDGDDFAEE